MKFDCIVQYYYNITMETSKWFEALLLGSTILSWSWSLSEWIQQRGVVILQSAAILGVPGVAGVAALYPRLVCPQPPHDVVQPLLPALRLLRLLQVRAARQEPLRAAAVARTQTLIGLDHVRPGPGEAGVGRVGVSEELLAAVVLQL